jgi:hypothetical protein
MQVNRPEQRNGPRVSRSLETSPPNVNAAAELVSGLSAIVIQTRTDPYLSNFPYSDEDFELEGPIRHESTSDGLPPPLGVKLTGYRLLNMSVVFVFGITKAILTYMGQSALPTTLDWVSGAFLAVW